MKKLLLTLCFLASGAVFAQSHNIIPEPVSYVSGSSVDFVIQHTLITVNDQSDELLRLADYLSKSLYFTPAPLKIILFDEGIVNKFGNSIRLIVDKKLKLPSEGYVLDVNSNFISIKSTTSRGLFYGIQTLLQIIPFEFTTDLNDASFANGTPSNMTIPDGIKSLIVKSCSITDYPRFSYRGMHLDVCRHIFPVGQIKQFLDIMAFYKMNNFHWHLTDDQGWRLEIKKYPLLTEKGAWRKSTTTGRNEGQDSIPYGGFYTQEQAAEIVAYAAERYINVIPEIEMPGHATAALAAYPEISCTGGPFDTWTFWGVNDEIFCAGKEQTFTFIEGVLDEVVTIFPSKYIHIGGDEAPKTRWNTCPDCQKRIEQEKLANAEELQSYFVQRAQKYLEKYDRQIIGWDEILEGGLAKGATVMSWRGIEGGIEAASMKHHVIMSPVNPCYLDYYQGDPATEPFAIGGYNTLEKVYSFEPVPANLKRKNQKFILGAQGNLWTEYISTSEHLEYMAYPRAIALAEVNWSQVENRDYNSFLHRLKKHYLRFDKLGINYARNPKLKNDN